MKTTDMLKECIYPYKGSADGFHAHTSGHGTTGE